MTLKEQIEAASAKATQGVWQVEPECYDDRGGRYLEISSRNPYDVILGDHGPNPEDAALIVTLVNAYRAGKLLVIEGEAEAVRRMADGIREADANSAPSYEDLATAALAALKGDKP